MASKPPPDEGKPSESAQTLDDVEARTAPSRSVWKTPTLEVLATYGLATVLVAVLAQLEVVPFVHDNLHALVGVVFVVGALWGARRAGGPSSRFGFALGGLLADVTEDAESRAGLSGLARDLYRAIPDAVRQIGVALVVAAVVLPPFAVGFWLWRRPDHPFVWSWGDRPLESAAAQLLVIALPEEVFFRGYVQTRLTEAFPAAHRIGPLQLSIVAILAQAALFGAVHIVSDWQPGRLAVFFPGILFGVVRSWRGGVGACIVLHALCNLTASTLDRGWR